MSGRIYLLLAAWGVVSFFMLSALCLAARRAIPKWSRQLQNEAEKQWVAVQTTVAAVPQAIRAIPSLPKPEDLLPRGADFQI